MRLASPAAADQKPCPEREAAQVVRTLLDRQAGVRMPFDSRARLSALPDGTPFPMPGGPGYVMLLRLPEASTPYTLMVRSRSFGALLFTGAIELTRVLPVFDFVADGLTLRKTPHREIRIPIAPADGERYVLLYTGGPAAPFEMQIVPSKTR
jgi:hypothetical protein